MEDSGGAGVREWLQENTPELMESTTEWMAREMTGLPVKSEFQISTEYFFTISISQIVLCFHSLTLATLNVQALKVEGCRCNRYVANERLNVCG